MPHSPANHGWAGQEHGWGRGKAWVSEGLRFRSGVVGIHVLLNINAIILGICPEYARLTRTQSSALLPLRKRPLCAIPKAANAALPIGKAAKALLVIDLVGKFWACNIRHAGQAAAERMTRGFESIVRVFCNKRLGRRDESIMHRFPGRINTDHNLHTTGEFDAGEAGSDKSGVDVVPNIRYCET